MPESSILLLVNGSSNYKQNILGKHLELRYGYNHINVDHVPDTHKLDTVISQFENSSAIFTVVTGLLHHVDMINDSLPHIKAANIFTIYIADSGILPAYSYKYSFTISSHLTDFYQKIDEIHDSISTYTTLEKVNKFTLINIALAFASGVTVGFILFHGLT